MVASATSLLGYYYFYIFMTFSMMIGLGISYVLLLHCNA